MTRRTARLAALGRCLGGVVLAGLLLAGCGAPEPRLATLLEEPALVAPVDAVLLGTVEEDSRRGLALDKAATVTRAFAVELDPQAAIDAWRTAYDKRYAFRSAGTTEYGLFSVMPLVEVHITAGEKVEGGPDLADHFDRPPAGTTVVTVILLGRGESVHGTES